MGVTFVALSVAVLAFMAGGNSRISARGASPYTCIYVSISLSLMPLAAFGPKKSKISANMIAGIPSAAEKMKKSSNPIFSAITPVKPESVFPTKLNMDERKAYCVAANFRSQREERYEVLQEKCKHFKIPEEAIWWYLETRKFGTVPHAGFGLGFERLMMFVTGMTNIRDVIPFPRTPKNAEF